MISRLRPRFTWILFGCVLLLGMAAFVQPGRLAPWWAIALATEQSPADLPKNSAAPLQLTPELLEEKLPEAKTSDTKPKADNFACFVCHANMEGEPLVEIHAREGHGCIECHGNSFAHRNDEDNITPPDVMFPPETIDPFCRKCHRRHNASAKQVVARFLECCGGKTDPEQVVCTDCHGKHRLSRRTVRWDKRTGKLLLETAGETPRE